MHCSKPVLYSLHISVSIFHFHLMNSVADTVIVIMHVRLRLSLFWMLNATFDIFIHLWVLTVHVVH